MTPAVIVDRARLQENIDRMAARARRAGVALRPHAKTHKSLDVAELQRGAGATGITTATVAEAEALASGGFDDLTVAYPPVGGWRIDRLLALARRVRLQVALADVEAARHLNALCRASGTQIGWLWEVDSGARRIGTTPGRATAELVAPLSEELRHATFAGLFTFAGHAYQARTQQELSEIAAFEQHAVAETAEALDRLGVEVSTLSIGSTPTAHFVDAAGPLDARYEIRPGNYVFYDATQVALGVAGLEQCALSVLATVVARPAADRVILDAGSKALAAERMTDRTVGFGLVEGHPELRIERLFEEHGIAISDRDIELPVGALVRVVPNHACATVNLHTTLNVLEDGALVDRWTVSARGWS